MIKAPQDTCLAGLFVLQHSVIFLSSRDKGEL